MRYFGVIFIIDVFLAHAAAALSRRSRRENNREGPPLLRARTFVEATNNGSSTPLLPSIRTPFLL